MSNNDSGLAEHLSEIAADVCDDPEVPTKRPTTKKPATKEMFHPGPFTEPTDYGTHCQSKREYKHCISFPLDQSMIYDPRNHQKQSSYRKPVKCETQKKKLKDIAKQFADNPGDEYLLRRFYITANQLFIYKNETTVCLLCIREKKSVKEKDPYPKSHIFPSSLLKAYGEIHCKNGADRNFILQESSGKTIGVKQLCWPLFCQECEKKPKEGFLRDVYLQIMGYSCDESYRLVITKDMSLDLRHVLAILMFSGVLMGINIVDEMCKGNEHFVKFLNIFFKLRKYCQDGKNSMAEDIHLFLLPNFHFNPVNPELTHILDFRLHNPQFTSVLTSSQGIPYLYMKFDCFHCVLPLIFMEALNL